MSNDIVRLYRAVVADAGAEGITRRIAGRWLIDPADADAYAASQRSRSTTPRRPRRMRRAS